MSTRHAERSTLLGASLSSASSLMALQLASRLITFILNQAVLRMTSPQAYGTAAIQFELLLSTILFLSREGVRNVLIRLPLSSRLSSRLAESRSVAAANLSLLPSILGLPLALLTTLIYGRLAGGHTKSQPYFNLATGLYAFAAMMELLSEPMHIR